MDRSKSTHGAPFTQEELLDERDNNILCSLLINVADVGHTKLGKIENSMKVFKLTEFE